MKKIIIFLIVITIFILFFLVAHNKQENISNQEQITEQGSFCYYQEFIKGENLWDISWLRVNIVNGEVSGEYHNYPAENNGKYGDFSGIYKKNDTGTSYDADVVWDAKAEGGVVQEQLVFRFNPIQAYVAVGEMEENSDGVFVYSNLDTVSYWQPHKSLPCQDLDEGMALEQYIRENIQTIVSEDPVLGGSWYLVSIVINKDNDTVKIVAEDGHIQNISLFSYEIVDGSVTLIPKTEE